MNKFNIRNRNGYYKGRIISIKTKDDCVSFKLCVYPKELNKNIGINTFNLQNTPEATLLNWQDKLNGIYNK